MRTTMQRASWAAAIFAATTLLLGGCTATPLPTPPTARASRMMLTEGQPMRLSFVGRAGAISTGGLPMRITTRTTAVTTMVAADGSFAASINGSRSDIFWLELLEPDQDLFIGAVTGVIGTPDVMDADAGPDRD